MLHGAYHLGNFWNSVSQTMQLQAGWQAVAILYIEIVFVSMGNPLLLIYKVKNKWLLPVGYSCQSCGPE